MHEWGLSRRLLELVEDEARARRLTQVRRVRVETAPLRAGERDALRFNFKAAARGTVAEDAELDLAERPVKALCPACLAEVWLTDHDQACPYCHAAPLIPQDGAALRVIELVAT